MVDRISKQRRSWNMSRIKSRDTVPEKKLRSLLHQMGYRFRVHRKDLPGCPDIVLPKYKKAIFVHGCFWHRHQGCKYAYVPKSRIEFWKNKFRDNIQRDMKSHSELNRMGWDVLTFWECEIKDVESIEKRIRKLLPK